MRTVTVIISTFSDEKKSDVAQLAAQVQYEYASGRRATKWHHRKNPASQLCRGDRPRPARCDSPTLSK